MSQTPSTDQPGQHRPSGRSPKATPRVIGGLAAFAIVAGSMLGIGIFLAPSQVVHHVADPTAFLLVFVVGGLVALAGAVTYAELGVLLPEAGGDYVFQSRAFGPSVAFASGWVLFAAIFTGSIATMSVAICEYQLPVLLEPIFPGYDPYHEVFAGFTVAQLVAVGLVVLLTTLNSTGAKLSAGFQTLLTLIPLSILAGLALWVLIAQPVTIRALINEAVAPHLTAVAETAGSDSAITIGGVVMAYMSVYFAYSGWNSVIYVAGEVKKPGRNLPRALIGGTVTVTLLYLIMCGAFLTLLGIGGLGGAGEAGTASASALGGSAGTILITTLIAMALVAGLNGTVLGGARVAYAMGKGGAFWKGVAKLSPRSRVPMRALWLQAAFTAAIILSGRFHEIYDMTTLAMIVTGTLTVASLFALRRKMPDAKRPYRALLYPWLPGLYLVSSAVVIVVTITRAFSDQDNGWFPLLGVAVLAAAYAFHTLWNRRQQVAAILAVVAIGGGVAVMAVTDARAAEPAEVTAETVDVAALQRDALAAEGSEESQALKRLYAVLTCKNVEAPAVPMARDYARYCRKFANLQAIYDKKVKSLAAPWIAERRPAGLPKTVLYPFSGADLVSSVLAFPDATLHIHMSLEHGGPVGALEEIASPSKRVEAVDSVLEATEGLLTLSDSKTKHLRLAHKTGLPGKLPITLTALAAHDAEVVSIRYFKLGEDGKPVYFAPGEMVGERKKAGHYARMDARWSNFELAFRLPGDPTVRILQHAVVNLHDSKLKDNEAVLAWLHRLGPVSFMTKAATYLLWSDGFSTIRDLALEQGQWMISDASGPLPSDLKKAGWEVQPYGRFTCDLLKWRDKGGAWEKANDEMAELFTRHSKTDLDFRFGYVDCRNRPSILIAHPKKSAKR